MEVKGKAVATVPSPASSSEGERSEDSVNGVSDSESAAAEIENDLSNSHNDVAESEDDVADGEIDLDDSDDDDSKGDEREENEAENVKDLLLGESEDQDPIRSLRKPRARASASNASRGGASSSKGPIARASSSKALRARASPWKAPVAWPSSSKALKPRASSSKALKARASSSIAPASGPWSDSDSGGSSNEVRSVSSPDSDGFTVRRVVLNRKKKVVAGTSRRRTARKPARSESSETEAEKTRKRKRKEVDGAKEAQRLDKKKEVVRGEASARSGTRAMFQRLWSEEDEIALLEGLREYELQKGTDPFSEMDRFSEFIKGSVNFDFTLTQLINKSRRMRRKFVKNMGRCKNGKGPSFRRSHDHRTFELSKTIWGDGRLNGPAKRGRPFGSKNRVASPKRKTARDPDAEENTRNFWTRYPWLLESIQIFPGMSATRKKFMQQKLMETSEEILEGLEGRWKGLWLSVCDTCLSRYQLIKDQLKLVQEGI